MNKGKFHMKEFTARNGVWCYGGTVVTHADAYTTATDAAKASAMYIKQQLSASVPNTSRTRWRNEIAQAGGLPAVAAYLTPAMFARLQLLQTNGWF